jgi:hypothetical protein
MISTNEHAVKNIFVDGHVLAVQALQEREKPVREGKLSVSFILDCLNKETFNTHKQLNCMNYICIVYGILISVRTYIGRFYILSYEHIGKFGS